MQLADVNDHLKHLLDKPEWSDEDRQWLSEYLDTTDAHELREQMLRYFEEGKTVKGELPPGMSVKMLDALHERISGRQGYRHLSVFRKRGTQLIAASLIGLMVLATIFQLNSSRKKDVSVKHNIKKTEGRKTISSDVPPGSQKAVLTLADGSMIVLDEVKNGAITRQGKAEVLKMNGKLLYQASQAPATAILYNTVSTPRGGQYQVILPDGSQVWLNAASSLHFPTAFYGKERRVEITGEAYFEVAKNTSMPFIVKINAAEIQVLGTHFNIMAYIEESVLKTTLIEGSVNFTNGGSSRLLKPGQQTQLTKDGNVKVASVIDVDKEVAWKNGFFHFESTDIKTVMRQLSRWYDVVVVYREKEITDLFYADIPRDLKLSDVLKALELTGTVHFEIENQKVIVGP